MVNNNEFDQIVAETAPDADGWIEWGGGECPVDDGDLIDVKFSDGDTLFGVNNGWDWGKNAGCCNIIAYRLHKPEQAKPEFCEPVMKPIPEPEIHSKNIDITKVDDINVVELRSTLDQLLQDWRNADDFAKRKQAEADEAAAMRDERWQAVQDRAGEFNVTVGRCESAAVEPELVVGSIAWDDLLEGDEMLCVIPFGGAVNEGSVGKVRHKAEGKITIDFTEQRYYVYCKSHFERGDVKFIRRP